MPPAGVSAQCLSMCVGVGATGGKVEGLELPKRVFPCASPAEVRSTLPRGKDVLAFQCRNPIHKAHYELFIRALEAPNVGEGAVCLVHPTCGPTQVCCPCHLMSIHMASDACYPSPHYFACSSTV